MKKAKRRNKKDGKMKLCDHNVINFKFVCDLNMDEFGEILFEITFRFV